VGRLLVLAAIAAVVYWFVMSCRRRPVEGGNDNGTEDTVQCVHCGVYLPKSEGLLANGMYFCGEAHRRAHIDTAHRE
jgi:uncharacterized protein